MFFYFKIISLTIGIQFTVMHEKYKLTNINLARNLT